MKNDFFSSSPDRSANNGFSGNSLNRLGEQRDTLDVAKLHADDRSRYHVMSAQRQLVKAVNPFENLFTYQECLSLGGDPDGAFLLGLRQDGTAEFALSVPRQEDYPGTIEAVDLRQITRSGVLNDENVGAIAQARSLVSWHQSHGFCPRCGSQTSVINAGYARHCASCDSNHFPRTDPVAIMLAIDGDDCLLGRSPSFPENMVSCLAGFVEAGETIEEAVRRELFEESGVQTTRVRYHSSQPWPFPSSLMVGCYAEAVTRDIVLDDELESCRWFSREETRQILAHEHPDNIWSPPQMAIANQLMRGFVDGI